MGDTTKIEWCDATFNPWIGCTEISTAEGGGGGCDACYARELDKRYRYGGATHWGAGVPRWRTSAANWKQPLAWNRKASATGTRPRVFCASLADIFDNEVSNTWRSDLIGLVYDTPNLDWLWLTKRIGNVPRLMEECTEPGRDWKLPPNVWLGITVVNQMEADRDIPKLLAIDARVRFLSCEPLLGAIDLEYPEGMFPGGPRMCCDGRECGCMGLPIEPPVISALDWIISGGESGPKARPSHPGWFRSLRDQCAAAGVAYLHKQNGEWAPGEVGSDIPMTRTERVASFFAGEWSYSTITPNVSANTHRDDEPDVYRFGKKAAGRLLDGREHNEFPETK